MFVAAFAALFFAGGCERTDPELVPDRLLQDSLGLTEEDRVYTVLVSGPRNRERAAPEHLRVRPGSWVEFVTADHRIHTVSFELDSLPSASVEFLRRSGQTVSPPLLERGARFLVAFHEAPTGRYPFLVEGNGAPVRGVVVVDDGPP